MQKSSACSNKACGFVEGVTTQNLLTTDPHPRNPTLADAFKRVGLVERTGRGVDLIYRGLLRYGRPKPDYSRSTSTSVVLRLSASAADLGFLRLVLDAERRLGEQPPIDSLIALTCLRDQRRLNVDELMTLIQKDRAAAKRTFEALVEAGLVERHGSAKGQSYTLAAKVYASMRRQTEYTRQAGFDEIQHAQMVMSFVKKHGKTKRPDVVKLCQITDDQATRLLKRLVEEGSLKAHGLRRWTYYTLPEAGLS